MEKEVKEFILNLNKIEKFSIYSFNHTGYGELTNGLIVSAYIQEIIRQPQFSTTLYLINFATKNFSILGSLTINCNPFENGMLIPNTEAGRVLFGESNG